MSEGKKLSRELQNIARELDTKMAEIVGRRVAFTLVVYTDGVGNVITTTTREDTARELETVIRMMRSKEPLITAHEGN